jgi:hypothetical protein
MNKFTFFHFLFIFSSFAYGLEDEGLKIGESFGRTYVSSKVFYKVPARLRKVARSTAEFGQGTAFYLGQFNGRHLMATNAHTFMANQESWTVSNFLRNPNDSCKIFPDYAESEQRDVYFGIIGRYFRCKKLVGIWSSIDFAIFEIQNEGEFQFKSMGVDIASSKSAGGFARSLSMFSYSPYENPGHIDLDLAYTKDKHCKTFTALEESKLIYDEDDHKNKDVGVWSIPVGCDIAPGDSGSALVDARTGEFVGIIWAGVKSKDKKAYNSKYLSRLLLGKVSEKERVDFVWNQMNYGVPAHKIIEVIEQSLLNLRKAEDQKTVKALLSI